MDSEKACIAAYEALANDHAERVQRDEMDRLERIRRNNMNGTRNAGPGPPFGYGRCLEAATGRLVIVERLRATPADGALPEQR